MKTDYSCILTTTINIPYFLDSLIKNIKKFKHKNVYIVIITDKKTPNGAKKYCKKISKKFNFRIDYLDLKFQKRFFKKYPKIFKLFPYNDALRRLLGSIYLLKQQTVPERLIFLDDDNFVFKNSDFLKDHLIVGRKIETHVVSNKDKFPNLYKYLKADENLPLFPRGFPWSRRNKKSYKLNFKNLQKGKVLANCGYILGDPDIDAVSRLFWKVDIKKITTNKNFYLAKNNYFPFNDQNTAISKDFFKIYFKPLSAGRNSDIWTSYVLTKIAHTHSDLISYGKPHLKQVRNLHDNWKDFEIEKKHNISTDLFIDILQSLKVKRCNTYFSTCYKLVNLAIRETRRRIEKNSKKKIYL